MKIPHAELVWIRTTGKPREIRVPFRYRPDGSLRPSRCTAGRVYQLTSTEKVKDEIVRHAVSVTCLQALKGEGDWFVTVRLGEHRDTPRYLKARPSAAGIIRKKPQDITPEDEHDDYTLRADLAMGDEPEPVSVAVQTQFSKDAYERHRTGAQHRLEAETRHARDMLSRTVDELSARKDLGEPAAKRLARIRRDLARLERELRAA